MSLLDPIRNYCERSGPGLWEEPLNVISNIAFFIAAVMLYRHYRRANRRDVPVVVLICLVTVVGIGSTLFHAFANYLSMLGDVIPIALFTFFYLWTALRRLLHLPKNKCVIALFVFAGAGALMSYVPAAWRFNGSVDYFPCLAALFMIGGALCRRDHAASVRILRAGLWFSASIIYRSVDMQLCSLVPEGTHFLWHMTNGWVLYLLVRAVMKRPVTGIN